MKYAFFIVALLSTATVWSQENKGGFGEAFRDSVLGYEEYLELVRQYHPVAIVANLELEFAEAELSRARGGFDPTIFGTYDAKEFKDVGYYDALTSDLVIPTWAGISLQAGYLSSSGAFLNPEKTAPPGGLINAGVTAQLGAGMLMDSRRAALRQAQIGIDQGQVDRILLLNKLYYEATQAYFKWAFAEQALRIAEEAIELANDRYDFVRESFRLGDVPAIDTVEAYTQVLNRLYKLREAQTSWVEAVNFAGVYLWDEDHNAQLIPPGVRPQALENTPVLVDQLMMNIDDQHPELERLQNTRDILNIDRRLAAEYLRPRVELSYNFLSENAWVQDEIMWFDDHRLLENNYEFKVKASFPLLLRDARGKVGLTKIKMSMVEQDFYNLKANLSAGLDAALVDLRNLRDQIGFFEQNVTYLERLLEGERQLFNTGESSLFLINAREIQLIEGRNMYFDLLSKEQVLYAEIRVIAGLGFP